MLRLVAVLAIGAAGTAPAQLAVSQPTEKLLIPPLSVSAAADSATSIAVTDAARERLGSLARYKVLLVNKAKMCEALEKSGFQCDGMMETRQAVQLANFLGVPSYTLGSLGHTASGLSATIHVVSGGSGFASTFTVTGGPNGSPQPLSEALAQKLFGIIRAAENARNCNEQRGRNNVLKASEEARKAIVIEPNLPAAHLCLANVYEILRLGPDSIIVEAQRALKGDPQSGEAWNRLANAYLAKGDSARYFDALGGLARSDIHNMNTAIGVASLMEQHKQYQKAIALADDVLAANPGNQQMLDLKRRSCIEGEQWRCVLDMFRADTTSYGDTVALRLAIGAAQQIADTQNLLFWTRQASQHFPRNTTYLKALAVAYKMAGRPDSTLAIEMRALQVDPNDINLSLLIAQGLLDRAVYDSAKARQLNAIKDTNTLHAMQAAFANRVDSVKPYIRPGLASPDSVQRLNAIATTLSAGSKLAQASAYDRAYPWLDTLLSLVAMRAPADTLGARQQIRVQASFWFGLSSILTIGKPYADMIKSKSCAKAKEIYDRLQRAKAALQLGGRVAPSVAIQMLGFIAQYEANMPKVKQAFHCTNF
jgi:tetratricopeptide (TPR) repeat protein